MNQAAFKGEWRAIQQLLLKVCRKLFQGRCRGILALHRGQCGAFISGASVTVKVVQAAVPRIFRRAESVGLLVPYGTVEIPLIEPHQNAPANDVAQGDGDKIFNQKIPPSKF